MRAGVGELKSAPATAFVTNVSNVNTFKLCEQKWFNEQIENRVLNIQKTDFLVTGTVGHDAIQDLHQMMGEWDSNAAVGVAHKHAERLEEETKKKSHLIPAREIETRDWFAKWLRESLPIYAEKYKSVPWEQVLCVEEAMWLEVTKVDMRELGLTEEAKVMEDCGYNSIIFVGRPDAVVVRREKVWHVQRKFFSGRTDLQEFLERAPFQKHEVLYLVIFQQLYEQGDFPFPTGHTLFDLIRKLDIPQHPSEMSPPKKCKCGAADGATEVDMMAVHTRMDNTRLSEHKAEEMEKQRRHGETLVQKQEAYDTWLNRAFIRDDAIIREKQRNRVFHLMIYDVCNMMRMKERFSKPTPSEGWACNAYFRSCPYKAVCAGRATLEDPVYIDREPSYYDLPEDANGDQ